MVSVAPGPYIMWVVVKIMVPLWVSKILVLYNIEDPKRDHDYDNHPYSVSLL